MIGRLGRWLAVVILAWAMPRASADELRQALDRAYRRRDDQWRRDVWRDAAERSARKSVNA